MDSGEKKHASSSGNHLFISILFKETGVSSNFKKIILKGVATFSNTPSNHVVEWLNDPKLSYKRKKVNCPLQILILCVLFGFSLVC